MSLYLTPLDIAIVVVYLVALVSFGLWMSRGQKGITDYLLGSRNLPWAAVLLSIVATETSTVTFLSVPGLAIDLAKNPHDGNLTFLQLAMGYIVGRHLVVWLLLPAYFRGELFTAYQVLEQRFGGTTKRVASGLFIVTRSLADGLRLFLTAVLFQKATGISGEAAILTIAIAALGYTLVGGIRAVVWTDCVQFAVYIVGAAVAGFVIVQRVGGWTELSAFAAAHDSFRVFDFSLDWSKPYTLWAGLVGGAFLSLGSHGTDQMMVQRYLCARGERDAARALAVSGWVILVQFAFFLLVGVGLACFFAQRPPAEAFQSNDEIFAWFIARDLPSGIRGLVLAAVVSAGLSTLSGSLNASASAAVNDLLLPAMKIPPASLAALRLSRVLTMVFAVVQIAVAVIGLRFGLVKSVVTQVLAIAGFTTGLVLGVFFLGSMTRVRERSALAALVTGLVVLTTLKFTIDLAWPWYTGLGVLIVFVVGVVVDRLFATPPAPGVVGA